MTRDAARRECDPMRRRSATMIAAAAAVAVCSALLTGASAVSAGTHAAAAAHAAASGGSWGTAKKVPGLAALNKGGNASITSVSCGSAGNCSAGGFYADGTFANQQAFVVSEKNGTWGTAKEAPGTAALNQTGNAAITSVSCASAGNCSAGGFYQDSNGLWAFVIGEKNGTWGTAKEAPGIAALNLGGESKITSVSCASAGNCSAGGSYTPNSNSAEIQAFVVVESNGTWGTAEQVPGIMALSQGGGDLISSVSCGAAGSCSAGGVYTDSSGHQQGFVAGETNGTWGTAKKVPHLAALNQLGVAGIDSVSCASAGSCSAGGFYTDGSGHEEAVVAGETNGTWGTAKEVPGIAALNQGGVAAIPIGVLSCASAGNCSTGGQYVDGSGHGQAFIVSETNGTWGAAEEVPGTAALNQGGNAQINSVSCASAGNCSAGGTYQEASVNQQAFVAGEKNGTWGTAKEVPGTAALNQGGIATLLSLSCASAGNCSAGGFYTDGSFAQQAFVVSES